MANKVAQASGNWNAISWLGGDNAVPTVGDIALAGAFDVTLNVNVSCTSLQANGTGQFLCSAARTIIANIINDGLAPAALVCSHLAGVVSITGNVTGDAGGTGVTNDSTGSVLVTGNVTGVTGGTGVTNDSTGSVLVTGNVTGNIDFSYGVYNTSTGSVNVTGNVTGDNGGYGVTNDSTGSVLVTGNVTGVTGTGIVNVSTGSVLVGRIENEQAITGGFEFIHQPIPHTVPVAWPGRYP